MNTTKTQTFGRLGEDSRGELRSMSPREDYPSFRYRFESLKARRANYALWGGEGGGPCYLAIIMGDTLALGYTILEL